MAGPYDAQHIALATKHGKEQQIAPAFTELLNAEIVVADVDTDILGTFDRRIARTNSVLDTAIAKARMGMNELQLPYGIASEGTIGPDPMVPWVASDIELVVFVDDQRELIVHEMVRSLEIAAHSVTVTDIDELDAALSKFSLPTHAVIVRPERDDDDPVIKGLRDNVAIRAAVAECLARGPVRIESDHRAHCSPSRQAVIAATATKLAQRLASACPECDSPGWGITGTVRGLPCASCANNVARAIRAHLWTCASRSCEYDRTVDVDVSTADPAQCDCCNP